MQKSFEIDSKEDLSLSEIEFKDNSSDEFILEIRCRTSKASTELKGKMLGFQRLYDMDSSSKQNFTLEHDISQNLVRMTGKIANAFHIMNERGLISEELYKKISDDKSVMDFVQKSKKFSFSNEDEVFDPSINEELEEDLKSIEKQIKKLMQEKLSELKIKHGLNSDAEEELKKRIVNHMGRTSTSPTVIKNQA